MLKVLRDIKRELAEQKRVAQERFEESSEEQQSLQVSY